MCEVLKKAGFVPPSPRASDPTFGGADHPFLGGDGALGHRAASLVADVCTGVATTPVSTLHSLEHHRP
ncbi:hypothetical protein P3102_31500 [Amycolatopsis sp. QT-25]|uniref:hypothetical protein n=1 Tax=Amycolatopsis sp. QT-25 TaxID=3034022 RepID=UPI0023EACB8F|nr:hypothetical protein [Amycolatopsis sp. QT-25]WET78534.1 hypothetical protein P3102_31500 [Amycolatopsis sp. QT-25]